MGILVLFSFVREHYWKFDQSIPIWAFENQQKILHAKDYPKWEAHRNFSGAPFFCSKKHFTTASEVNSYQEHLKNHKPQEMITQYACNSL